MVTSAAKPPETRGRPRLRTDDEILHAALLAFADYGYEGMSLRTLNSELGFSRGTINQRFGSKEKLWYLAVDRGFAALIAEIQTQLHRDGTPDDDRTLVRSFIRAFLVASAGRPEIVKLMNQEGLHSTARLDHIVSAYVLPTIEHFLTALERLAQAGLARRLPARVALFLIAHGAAAPFTLQPLSQKFDDIDGPLVSDTHIELVTDIILAGFLTPA